LGGFLTPILRARIYKRTPPPPPPPPEKTIPENKDSYVWHHSLENGIIKVAQKVRSRRSCDWGKDDTDDLFLDESARLAVFIILILLQMLKGALSLSGLFEKSVKGKELQDRAI